MLAMAVCQVRSVLTESTQSPASRLLQDVHCVIPFQHYSRCWEISLEISTIEVLPVNSNFTLPSDEK